MLARATRDPWKDEEDPQELMMGMPRGSLVPGMSEGKLQTEGSMPHPKTSHSQALAGARLEENPADPLSAAGQELWHSDDVTLVKHLSGDQKRLWGLKGGQTLTEQSPGTHVLNEITPIFLHHLQ